MSQLTTNFGPDMCFQPVYEGNKAVAPSNAYGNSIRKKEVKKLLSDNLIPCLCSNTKS